MNLVELHRPLRLSSMAPGFAAPRRQAPMDARDPRACLSTLVQDALVPLTLCQADPLTRTHARAVSARNTQEKIPT